jgi:exodeoxyribonuclease VII small subunit
MSPASSDTPTFETALAELERILRALEDGTTSLEESLTQYERGVGLLKRCYQQLCDAEQRIVLLSGVDGDGKPIVEPFNHQATVSGKPEETRRQSRPKPKEPEGLY